MKVLHINISDVKGGASKAAYRLHHALLNEDIQSKLFVQHQTKNEPDIFGSNSKALKAFGQLRPVLDQLPIHFFNYKPKTYFNLSWLPFGLVPQTIKDINPDIVHFHWVCGGMMSLNDFTKIEAPMVWSMHDNWAFTGGCNIKWDCEAYKTQCGNCPILNSKKNQDLSTWVFKRKQKVFSKLENLNIVGVSRWMEDCVRESALLRDKFVTLLPNPINTSVFKYHSKEMAREQWGFHQQKKLILFGAVSATSDPNKGYKEILEALTALPKDDVELIVFGSSQPKNAIDFGINTHYMGHINDDKSLVSLYNAADVMVVPSLQEAFGQTACEAMSCATPVVAFATTGLLDIVDHKVNGYLAKAFDTKDLANGIEWALNASNYDELCQNAREKVVNSFDSKLVAKKYIALYEKILNDV